MSRQVKINVMAREAFWDHAHAARTNGRDLAEVLDREGYLLTPSRHAKIQADTIDEIADLLGSTSPHQWNDNGNTQMDLMAGIVRRLRVLADDRRI